MGGVMARQTDSSENRALLMGAKRTSWIQITRFDKKRLIDLLHSLDRSSAEPEVVEDLANEVSRGVEVESTEIARDVVTMNSTVRVTDVDTGAAYVYTLVFPSDVDPEKGRISIVSPLGTALIGESAGAVVVADLPRGPRRLRIEEIVYQPEAAGDFHL